MSSVLLKIFRSKDVVFVFEYGEISLQGIKYRKIKGVHIVMHSYIVKKLTVQWEAFLYFSCLSEDQVPNVYRGGSQSINNVGFDSSC